MKTTGEGHTSNFGTFHKFKIFLINLTIVFLFGFAAKRMCPFILFKILKILFILIIIH